MKTEKFCQDFAQNYRLDHGNEPERSIPPQTSTSMSTNGSTILCLYRNQTPVLSFLLSTHNSADAYAFSLDRIVPTIPDFISSAFLDNEQYKCKAIVYYTLVKYYYLLQRDTIEPKMSKYGRIKQLLEDCATLCEHSSRKISKRSDCANWVP
ncbi:hypothetical protein WAI453_008684 [Rhynchosporium graminicola]